MSLPEAPSPNGWQLPFPGNRTSIQVVDKLEHIFDTAADIISGADALVIAAGAGIGVDSGLPDFRSNNGFWKAYPALAAAQIDFTEVASPQTFKRDPQLAWGFYGHRLSLYRSTVPHHGFQILKGWAERSFMGSWVYTSNVDGAFQKAGFAESQVHECHGSIHHMQCLSYCKSLLWTADGFSPEVDVSTCRLQSELPKCPDCGGLARPNIMMFGDWDWNEMRTEGQRKREELWLNTIAAAGGRIAVIELGAGTAIPAVRHFSHRICQELGALLVRINPREYQVPSAHDVGIPLGSLEALVSIQNALNDSAG